MVMMKKIGITILIFSMIMGINLVPQSSYAENSINVSIVNPPKVYASDSETSQSNYVYRFYIQTDVLAVAKLQLKGRTIFSQTLLKSQWVEVTLDDLGVGEHTLDITLTYNINGEEYTDSRSVIVYVTSNKAIIPSDVDIPDTGYVQIGNVIYDRSSLILTVAIVIVLCVFPLHYFSNYTKRRYIKK